MVLIIRIVWESSDVYCSRRTTSEELMRHLLCNNLALRGCQGRLTKFELKTYAIKVALTSSAAA